MSLLVFGLNFDETEKFDLITQIYIVHDLVARVAIHFLPIFDPHDVCLSKYCPTCHAQMFRKCSFCQALLIYEDYLPAIS